MKREPTLNTVEQFYAELKQQYDALGLGHEGLNCGLSVEPQDKDIVAITLHTPSCGVSAEYAANTAMRLDVLREAQRQGELGDFAKLVMEHLAIRYRRTRNANCRRKHQIEVRGLAERGLPWKS